MDKREMKKGIIHLALSRLLFQAKPKESGIYDVGMIVDQPELEITDAQYSRYLKLLQEMVDNAESKLK